MKKICFITPMYSPANLYGSGIVVKILAEELAKSGFTVSVVTSNALTSRYWYDPIFGKKLNSNFEIINKVKVYRTGCNQILSGFYFILVRYLHFFLPKSLFDKLRILSSGPYMMGLENILRENNFDVIHCSPAPLALNKQVSDIVKTLKKKPYFVFTPFFHSSISDFDNTELQEIFDRADAIHVISQVEKDEICKRYKISKNKIKIIPLFLKLAGMHNLADLNKDIEIFKKKYGLKGKKIVLFAGIKGRAKGAIDLLKAINILHKADKKFILIAMGANTSEWEKTKKEVDKNCLLDFEYVEDKKKEIIFGVCDVFCMPSQSETFGLVYLEAWHKKKPVIAANIPAVRHLVGSAGLFVEFGNINNIIDQIKKLSYNKALMEQKRDKGYNRLMNTYNFSKIFPKYIELFEL